MKEVVGVVLNIELRGSGQVEVCYQITHQTDASMENRC